MSRQDRLREYSKPLRAGNWQGAGRDQANIDRWSERASENSQLAPRASDGPMHLPSTKMNLRDSAMKPYRSQGEAMRKEAKSDMDIEGDSPYLRGVRRGA